MKVAVVGAGLAGSVAAARLASGGAKVTVYADRPGATIMHGGGWYLGLSKLPRFGVPPQDIGVALAFVESGLVPLQLKDGPFALRDVDGVQRVVDMAPQSHAVAAALDPAAPAVDFTPLGHPFASMQARPVLAVEYPGWDGAFGRSFAAVATRLDEEAEQDRLGDVLKSAVKGRELPGLLLPPILGVTDPETLRRSLEDHLGIPVGEALDCVPSAPGLRLNSALEHWLDGLGVARIRARVTALDLSQHQVRAAERWRSADAVVLATGGVLAGGLTPERPVVEPLLGLRVDPPLPFDLQSAVRPDRPFDGDVFRAGVPVDGDFRPLTHAGEPVHRGLFAVGDLVAGPEGIVDRCSSGLAIVSGYLAAERLLEVG